MTMSATPPASPVHIRRATRADVPQLAPVFEEYRTFYGVQPDLARASDFLDARLASGDSAVFIAIPEGQASTRVGFVQLYPSFSSLGMCRIEILNDLFVVPAWRRRGVARALLATAIEYAAALGAGVIELSTARTNAPARALYLAFGFRVDACFERMQLVVSVTRSVDVRCSLTADQERGFRS
jgi:ribosomal protein S18 acetylase RimI-like enzyme